jgi:hypothetical protein
MRTRMLPLVVLVTAVAALVGSAAWAVGGSDDGGWGMHRFGNGMMGYADAGGGDPVGDLAEARRQAGRFADRLDLKVGEVMRFSNQYYAELEEDGQPATEVLVDPQTGSVYLEYGPAMMWNTRFGMMSGNRFPSSGMMGGAGMMDGAGMMSGAGMKGGSDFADPTWAPTGDGDVSAAEARGIARRWLAKNGKGLAAGEPETFPGYYTLHLLRDGKIAGMMSVNAVTGAPWYHWWHGRFVSMSE